MIMLTCTDPVVSCRHTITYRLLISIIIIIRHCSAFDSVDPLVPVSLWAHQVLYKVKKAQQTNGVICHAGRQPWNSTTLCRLATDCGIACDDLNPPITRLAAHCLLSSTTKINVSWQTSLSCTETTTVMRTEWCSVARQHGVRLCVVAFFTGDLIWNYFQQTTSNHMLLQISGVALSDHERCP